jgi:hypothetical protein
MWAIKLVTTPQLAGLTKTLTPAWFSTVLGAILLFLKKALT